MNKDDVLALLEATRMLVSDGKRGTRAAIRAIHDFGVTLASVEAEFLLRDADH